MTTPSWIKYQHACAILMLVVYGVIATGPRRVRTALTGVVVV